jgi:hypothetical protein
MTFARLISGFALCAVFAACGGSSSTSPAIAAGDAGSTGPGTAVDDGGVGVTSAGDTVTLTMGPFTVPPGTEVFKCQDFANPFGGMDQDIKEYEVHMTAGSHHMFIFFSSDNANAPIQDCPAGGLEFHPYPFSTQTRDASITYPDTVGSRVPATTGFRMNAHYINAGATPMDGATVTATLHKAAPGTVTQHAGVIFMNDVRLSVPPGKSTSSSTCSIPANINIMAAASHMHQRATGFTAKTADGTMLYQSDRWSDPVPRIFTPALNIPKKTDVTWGCSYDNETAGTLTFGEFAQTNVMCIFTMHYYPVADPKNPTIDCENF